MILGGLVLSSLGIFNISLLVVLLSRLFFFIFGFIRLLFRLLDLLRLGGDLLVKLRCLDWSLSVLLFFFIIR